MVSSIFVCHIYMCAGLNREALPLTGGDRGRVRERHVQLSGNDVDIVSRALETWPRACDIVPT